MRQSGPPIPVSMVKMLFFLAVLIVWAPEAALSQTKIPADISFFLGVWSIEVASDPGVAHLWIVKEEGDWVYGNVERNGERTSSDFWRKNGNNIERYAFTSDGLYIKLVSSGWKAGKMVFVGIASGAKTGDFRVRETITRAGDRKFRAIWEKQEADGRWTIFSDEQCSK